MPKRSLEERVLAVALGGVSTSTTLAPGPPSARGPRHSSPKAALHHCCAAWQRAFDAYMNAQKRPGDFDHILAARPAGEAYCNAMPMLDGYDGVCAFIACTAHGILIGAIPKERGGQLLYAAQVALATVQKKPKSPAPALSDPPPPPDHTHFGGLSSIRNNQ